MRRWVPILLTALLGASLVEGPPDASAGGHYLVALGISTTEQGHQAPDFALRDRSGTVHRLRGYLGKVVLLSFAATW